MSGDEYESEIDKIYKKHNKLDEIVQFDLLYSNAIHSPNDEAHISKLLKEANEHEAQQRDIQACALYLASIHLLMVYHGDKVQQEQMLTSSKKAIKIALKHDSRLQRKLLDVLRRDATHRFFRGVDGLEIHDQLLTEVLQVAEALADKEILLEFTGQLAKVKQSQKKFQEAIALYKKCIQLAPQQENYRSGVSSAYFDSLQAIYNEQGNTEAANALVKERIAAAEQNSDAPMSLEKLGQLQELYLKDGKIEQAADTLKKTLAELEKQVSKPVNPNGPFRRFNMYQVGASIDASLRFARKLEEKGLLINDVHEKLLRMQYQTAKEERDSWISSKLKALTSFLMKIGKAADAAAILKAELADQKGKVHPHDFSQLESNYLSALKAANMTDEYNKIISEKSQERKKQIDEQAKALVARLEVSRKNIGSDPNTFFQLATAVIGQHLQSQNNQQAAQLKNDVFEAYNTVPRHKLDASSLVCIWSLSRLSSTGAKTNQASHSLKLEKELVEAYEKLVAQSSKDGEYYSSNDLTEQVYTYSGRESLEDRVDFVNFVIDLRKRFNPKNVGRLHEAYEWLAKAYSESGNIHEEKKARAQLLSFLNTNRSIDKTLVLRQEIEIAVLSFAHRNTEQTLKKLESFLPEVSKCEASAQSVLASRIFSGFCTIAKSFVDNDELQKAQEVLKLANELARKNNRAFPNYEQNQILDRITSVLLAKSDYLGAESNLALKISLLKSSQQGDLAMIELGDCMVRLSETMLLHSRTLADQAEAQKLVEKSLAQLREAIDVYGRCKSDYAPWSIGWSRRRHEYILRSGKNPDDFHKYEPLNVKVRHHLQDVPNQAHGQAPQPFACAVLARSLADIGAACRTEIVDSSNGLANTQSSDIASLSTRPRGLTVAGQSTASSSSANSDFSRRLSGAEVLSTGKTLLNGTAKIPATVAGRSIVMTGSNIKVLGNLDASGDIPEAFRWTGALAPPSSAKIIPAVVAGGKIEAASDGAVADLGELSLSSDDSLKICAGDYLISRIAMSPGANIEVDKTTGANKPVRFFVRDIKQKDLAQAQVLIEGAAVNKSGVPAEMQFWCSGEGLVLIKGSKVNSIFYAPNAPIVVSASHLIGALAADEVRLRNGTKISFDIATPSLQKLGLGRLQVPDPDDPNEIQGGGGGSITCIGARADESYQARKYVEFGEYNDAIKSYTEAISIEPTVQNYIGRAYCYFRTDQYELALADCKVAIDDEPDYAFAHAICGMVYQRTGETEKAKAEFSKAIELCPIDEDMDDLLFLALCQSGIGNSDVAIEILSEALAVMNSDSELYLFRAGLYDSTGQHELANKDRAKLEELRKKQLEKRQQEREALERAKEMRQIIDP
ncbi:MAG: hypothetical protein K2X77_00065 [Candidatus Obscuribacterales bacterium]|nr:hypothetical protein [Candidatus Obscuribacterales bacterium]